MIKLILAILLIFVVTSASYAADGIRINIAPIAAQFHLVNPNGLITGYTPAGILNQIAEVDEYVIWGANGPEGSDNPYDEYHVINQDGYPAFVSPGKYQLVLYGINAPIQAQIEILFWWVGKGKKPEYYAMRLLYPNVVWRFEFEIPTMAPPPGSQITLTKISNPNDLITDINAANSIGHLGSVYQSLLSKAQNAKAKLDAGQPQAAKNTLNAFINEVTAQKGKQINANAADILIEDAQYIISHN